MDAVRLSSFPVPIYTRFSSCCSFLVLNPKTRFFRLRREFVVAGWKVLCYAV